MPLADLSYRERVSLRAPVAALRSITVNVTPYFLLPASNWDGRDAKVDLFLGDLGLR